MAEALAVPPAAAALPKVKLTLGMRSGGSITLLM
jgi:hypothetical protein